MLLEMARAVGVAADHLAHLGIVLQRLDSRAEPERGARKARSARFAGQVEDRDRIGQCPRHGLVDEDRLTRLKDRTSLGQMGPSVHALQQHHIHLLEQVVDRSNDLDPVLFVQFPGEARDAVAARGQRPGCPRVTRNDAYPGEPRWGCRSFRSWVNAVTCEVSRPMMPALAVRAGAARRSSCREASGSTRRSSRPLQENEATEHGRNSCFREAVSGCSNAA